MVPHGSSLAFTFCTTDGHVQSALVNDASSCTGPGAPFSAASHATPDLRPPSITAGNAFFIHSQKYVADVTRLDLHIEIITVRRQTQR